MEDNVSGNLLLPEVLRALEGRTRGPVLNLAALVVRTIERSAKGLPLVRKRIRSARGIAGIAAQRSAGRTFFTVPHNENAGAIRLNVKGREPGGVVEKGTEYSETCGRLKDSLLALRDATGQQPVVNDVIRVHEQFDGPYVDILPDLLVTWNRDADLSEVSSDEIGVIKPRSRPPRSGDHSSMGLVISQRTLPVLDRRPVRPADVTQLIVGAL